MNLKEEFTEEQIEEILRRGFYDIKFFARFFMPERFNVPFDDEHDEIFDLLKVDLNGGLDKKVLAAPRNVGKSTICSFAYPIWLICYRISPFTIIISSTSTVAEAFTEAVKVELESNALLTAFFNISKGRYYNKDIWGVIVGNKGDEFEAVVSPKGAGQQLRGTLYGNKGVRPSIIICDDLISDEVDGSEVAQAKILKWFYSVVVGAFNTRSKWSKLFVVGTISGKHGFLKQLMSNNAFSSKTLEICDAELNSKFPNVFPTEAIKLEYQTYVEAGAEALFNQEYRNISAETETHNFDASKIIRYNSLPIGYKYEKFILIDPAKKHKNHVMANRAADTAIISIAVDKGNNKVYLNRVVAGKLSPEDTIRVSCDMAISEGASIIYAEVTGLNAYFTDPFKQYIESNDLDLELLDIEAERGVQPGTGKDLRIKNLKPLVEKNILLLNASKECDVFYEQYRDYPNAYAKDVIDLAGHIPKVLTMQGIHLVYSQINEVPKDLEIVNEKRYTVIDFKVPMLKSVMQERREEDFYDRYLTNF